MKLFLNSFVLLFFLVQSTQVYAISSDGPIPNSIKYTNNNTAPTAQPLLMNIDMAGLSENEYAALNNMAEAIRQNLYYWANLPIVVPQSIFQVGNQVIEIDDLYKQPTSDEIYKLGTGPDGKPKELSAQDQETISKKALIIIPSVDYPGMSYVWKITGWLQKGSDNITMTLQKDVADGLYHLIVGIPERIWRKDGIINFRNGFRNLFIGLGDSLSFLVGFTEKRAVYSESEVDRIVKENQLETAYRKVESQNVDTSYLQIYDAAIMDRAAELLAKIYSLHTGFWEGTEGIAKLNQIRTQNPQASNQEIESILTNFKNEDFLERINKNRNAFESINPGLTKAIRDHSAVLKIIYQGEQAIVEESLKARMEIEETVRQQNPIKSKVSKWFSDKVASLYEQTQKEISEAGYKSIEANLRTANLNIAADMLVQTRTYMENDGQQLKANLEAQTEATRSFDYYRRIWFPSNYQTEVREISDENGKLVETAVPRTYITSTVSTDTPLWRLLDIGHSTRATFKNANYWLLVKNYINGPLGVRSLFGVNPFYANKEFNPKTGSWQQDPNSLTQTMVSRYTNLWENVRRSEKEFLAQPSNFIAREKLVGLYNVWNKGVKGGLGTAALFILQPTATLIGNTIFTAAGSGLSVGWAPVTSAFMWGVNWSIKDTNDPKSKRAVSKYFPLASTLIVKSGILGGAQIVGSILGSIYHGGMSLGRIGFGYGRSITRTAYDKLIRGVYIRPFGKLPTIDNTNPNATIHRTEGPGISSEYYVQLKPEIAVAGLRAILEQNELKAYGDRTTAQIQEPVKEFQRFMEKIVGQIAAIYSQDTMRKYSALGESTEYHTKQLRLALEARSNLYSQILGTDFEHRQLIRQSTEDLNQTLRQGTALVKDFYLTRIFNNLNSAEIASFWNNQRLAPDSWQQLTERLLSQTFSEGFLMPLEESDKTYRFVAEHQGLKGLIDAYEGRLEPVEVRPVALNPTNTSARREFSLNPQTLVPSVTLKSCQSLFAAKFVKRFKGRKN